MGYGYRKFRARVRANVIAEVDVRVYCWDEPDLKKIAEAAEKKSQAIILQRARRPITGGEFSVLTIEPTQDIK